MAAGSAKGPASLDEALNGVAAAVTAALTVPDAQGPQAAALMQLLQMVLGIKKMGAAGGQQAKPPGQPGMGGGMNLGQLQGQPPSGPSAGMGGGPTQSGAGSDDIRRMVAAQAS